MVETLRKRKGDKCGTGEPEKRVRTLARCPNCNRPVGASNYILCTKCDAPVHLLCTQLTTDDAVNETSAFSEFQCHHCAPPLDVDNTSGDEMLTDEATALDQGPISVFLRSLLNEVRALRCSNRRLEHQTTLLTAEMQALRSSNKRLERLVSSRGAVKSERSTASTKPARRSRSGNARRSTPSPARSSSSRRSSSRVSFTAERTPYPQQTRTRRPNHIPAANARYSRATRRVVRVVGAAANRARNVPASSTQEGTAGPAQAGGSSSQLPAARIQMRCKEVFVSRLEKGITAARVHAHLKENGISTLQVKKIQPRFATHSSFIISVTNIDYAKIFQEHLWATGTVIMDYIERGTGPHITDTHPSQV